MSTTIDLTGKRALVSGVTSGIGAGIARALAQAGCDVAGCGRTAGDEASAQAFLKDVRDAGGKAHYIGGRNFHDSPRQHRFTR